jgi:hypothetical protein
LGARELNDRALFDRWSRCRRSFFEHGLLAQVQTNAATRIITEGGGNTHRPIKIQLGNGSFRRQPEGFAPEQIQRDHDPIRLNRIAISSHCLFAFSVLGHGFQNDRHAHLRSCVICHYPNHGDDISLDRHHEA